MAKHKINRTGRGAVVATGIAAAVAISIAATGGFGADDVTRRTELPSPTETTSTPQAGDVQASSRAGRVHADDWGRAADSDWYRPSLAGSAFVNNGSAESGIDVSYSTKPSSSFANNSGTTSGIVVANHYGASTLRTQLTQLDPHADYPWNDSGVSVEFGELEPSEVEKSDLPLQGSNTESEVTDSEVTESEYVATIPDNNGSVIQVDVNDVMENNYGEVHWNGGTIVNNYGEVHWNGASGTGINGLVVNNYGTVHHNAGIAAGPNSTPTDSTIVNNYGEVLGYQGDIVNDHTETEDAANE